MASRMVVLLLALLALGVGACSDEQTGTLSADEKAQVAIAQEALQSYCGQVSLYLAGKRGPPREELVNAGGRIDVLIGIARRKPDADYRGRTLRELLGDMAEDLEGTNCSPDLELRIERGLASLP
jgi:hypothetical protein